MYIGHFICATLGRNICPYSWGFTRRCKISSSGKFASSNGFFREIISKRIKANLEKEKCESLRMGALTFSTHFTVWRVNVRVNIAFGGSLSSAVSQQFGCSPQKIYQRWGIQIMVRVKIWGHSSSFLCSLTFLLRPLKPWHILASHEFMHSNSNLKNPSAVDQAIGRL